MLSEQKPGGKTEHKLTVENVFERVLGLRRGGTGREANHRHRGIIVDNVEVGKWRKVCLSACGDGAHEPYWTRSDP
jgi:hypothetical protein